MRDALQEGLKTAPGWAAVIVASLDWGIPPWEICPEEPKILWWERYMVYKIEYKAAMGSERERLLLEAEELRHGRE